MEIWDAYKQDGKLAGSDLIRGEAIPKGVLISYLWLTKEEFLKFVEFDKYVQ